MWSDETFDGQRYLEQPPVLIEPWDSGRLQPASFDVTLGPEFMEPLEEGCSLEELMALGPIDPRDLAGDMLPVRPRPDGSVIMPGRGFLLGATVERVSVRETVAVQLDGKSSIGRMGLLIHLTAGFIDPGFAGNVTLELHNVRDRPLLLFPGMPIGQLRVLELTDPCTRTYGSEGLGSKYTGRGVEPSRMDRNFGGNHDA